MDFGADVGVYEVIKLIDSRQKTPTHEPQSSKRSN